jgi:general stress protein 26
MHKVKKEVVEIIRASEVAFLSTINLDNFPETRALINVLNKEIDDKLEIYFASDANAPKFEQLKKNSCASLYYYNEGIIKNMTLFGKAEVVTDKTLKDKLWHESFWDYYKNGKDDKQYGVLKFIPTGYKYYVYENGCTQIKNEGKF